MGMRKYNDIAWILSCMAGEDYDGKELTSAVDKCEFVAECIKKEALEQRYANRQNCISSWLQGLPSAVGIPFTNYDILQLAKEWGYDVSTEKKEAKFLENYWNASAMSILKAFKKYGVQL
jgi:hypothetical protein